MLKRRAFIEWITRLGVVTALAPLFSCSSGGQESSAEPEPPTVYRFQTKNARVCNACKMHQHYKVFLNETSADQNRAHPGCNCRIVTQEITQAYSDAITPFEQNGVIDLRHLSG